MKWNKLETKGPAPYEPGKPLVGHAASVWYNKIMIHGGKIGEHYNFSTYMLDLRCNTWIKGNTLEQQDGFPIARWKHASCSDYYSHLASKSFDRHAKHNLHHAANMQTKEYTMYNEHDSISVDALPAEALLTKYTRMYMYGGIGPTMRYNDLHELTFSLQRKTTTLNLDD